MCTQPAVFCSTNNKYDAIGPVMGRIKTNSGGPGSTSVTSERMPPATTTSTMTMSSSSTGHLATASSSSSISLNNLQTVDLKLRDSLRELYFLIHQVQEERARGEHNLTNITKTHERMQVEQKISPYFKSKLRGLYNTAMQDAESESQLLRKALDKIAEIKTLQEQGQVHRPKQIMRRGVLMNMLQQNAITLPLWIGKPGER
ncbi:SAGA-associated factor 29 [Lamellibrachia satsuma]|nr:SAGA-associated factor 29 [Lamellibrachia satsuma]